MINNIVFSLLSITTSFNSIQSLYPEYGNSEYTGTTLSVRQSVCKHNSYLTDNLILMEFYTVAVYDLRVYMCSIRPEDVNVQYTT